jgi:sialate O-acetylesterase
MRKFVRSIVCGFALAATPALADVRLPAIFGDHMVLQRDRALPVWGWADAGEAVTIRAGAAIASATAGADGSWSAKLNSLAATAEPITVTVSGKNTIELKDVLVGDVWLCAGQSNMGWSVGGVLNAAEVLPKAKDDQLRLFMIDGQLTFDVQVNCRGRWVLCNPTTVSGFSAIGYFMGRDLREHLKVPTGLIESSMGGTASQAWTSREALDANPTLKGLMDVFRRDESQLREKTRVYETLTVPQWKEADQAWRRDVNPDYQKQLTLWNVAAKQAKTAGQPEPAKPQPSQPRPTLAPPPNRLTPTVLYNGMIAPIVPFAIKGVAWCQGEHNTFDPEPYPELLTTMIRDWRSRWHQGDVPFVYVQNADNPPKENGGVGQGNWARVREAQRKLAEPNTAMVVAVDVGDPTDIHYRNKQPIGQRMALAARHLAYAEDLAWAGPAFDHADFANGQATLHFKHAESGLMTGRPPIDSPFATPAEAPLRGFEIAGASKEFVPAEASIAGQTVVVKNLQVNDPVAVRYGWSDAPSVNLYNRAGLPASPFSTDHSQK